MSSLSFKSQARIICAGTFHNFILATFLLISSYLLSGSFYTYIGHQGRSVINVNKGSEVGAFIHKDTIITSIDTLNFTGINDTDDGSSNGDIWDRYLLSQLGPNEDFVKDYGWNISKSIFQS